MVKATADDAKRPKKSIVEELAERLDTFKKLTSHGSVRVFINDYFCSIRNEIDIKAEELIMKLGSEMQPESDRDEAAEPAPFKAALGQGAGAADEAKKKNAWVDGQVKEVNEKRAEMLAEIEHEERSVLDELEKVFTKQVQEGALAKWEYFEVKSKRLDEMLEVLDELENEIVKYKKLFLLNKSYIFKPFIDPYKLGVLIIIDIYLKSDEITLIKESSVKNNSVVKSYEEILSELAEINSREQNEKTEANYVREFSRNVYIIYLLFKNYIRFNNLSESVASNIVRVDEAFLKKELVNITEFNLSFLRLNRINKDLFEASPNLTELLFFHNQLTGLEDNLFKNLKNLQKLDLSMNHLEDINLRAFYGLENLKVLLLANNPLERLKNNQFLHLVNLKVLNLNENQIEDIDLMAFNGLASLEELSLFRNNIKRFKDHAFKPLAKLKSLKLNLNKLECISEETFSGLVRLTTLNLNNNVIESLGALAFKHAVGLTQISANSNRIKYIHPSAFANLINVANLDLTANKLAKLEKNSFEPLKNLKALKLTKNKLESLPAGVFNGLSQLEFLYLTGNELASLSEESFKNLACLKKLFLDHNKIASLPKNAFYQTVRLSELDLSHNCISDVQTLCFNGLLNLDSLKLDFNEISTLRENSFASLWNLRHLTLNNNCLDSLGNEAVFEGLANLSSLNLMSNQLSQIHPGAFKGLAKLQTLNLSMNQISSLASDQFEQLESLSLLNLSQNLLTSLHPGSFRNVPNLQTVILTSNRLTEFGADKELLDDLKGLRKLMVDNNGLEAIAGSLEPLEKLEELDLNQNKFKTFDCSVLVGLKSLKTLNLLTNRFDQATEYSLTSSIHQLFRGVENFKLN